MGHITISIEYKEKQLDYQVPTNITFSRLVELFHQVFSQMKLPKEWTLQLKNKAININQTDILADLPIGNGDLFYIVDLT